MFTVEEILAGREMAKEHWLQQLAQDLHSLRDNPSWEVVIRSRSTLGFYDIELEVDIVRDELREAAAVVYDAANKLLLLKNS